MLKEDRILVGKSEDKELGILLNKANRHGIITGATGSGKTITLKVMAESFSDAGVPVFLADVKGDLAGTALPGSTSEALEGRLNKLGIDDFKYKGFPVHFWDVYGTKGHPIRATVSSIGPQIMSRMLGLTEAQSGIMSIIFKIAKEQGNGWELTDLKDLRLFLQYVGEHRQELTLSYGNITSQSVGAIQRNVLMLEEQGGDQFFGEPSIDVNDFIKTSPEDGRGYINILDAQELFNKPNLYACFMLWLLTALYNACPEVGDLDKPKMVFFFDEAHLLFDNMPSYIIENVIQMVKLIRSKGIGLYFISQAPNDVPDEIMAQLQNRVQHTLRAYTPAEQKNIKAAADGFRENPKFNTMEAIKELGTGEALISFINEKGEPEIVEKATILPPQSQMGSIDSSTRLMIMTQSLYKGKYDEPVDNPSSYETIKEIMEEEQAKVEEAERLKQEEKEAKEKAKEEEKKKKEEEKKKREEEKKMKSSEAYKFGQKAKNAVYSTIIRGVINGVKKGFKKK